MIDKIGGLIVIILGIQILITQDFNNNRGMLVDLSNNYLYIIAGIGLLVFGCFIIYSALKKNKNTHRKQEYAICPKCKESFFSNELKEGKCKYCEDVDTIDIEEYYKNNPNKKRNKK